MENNTNLEKMYGPKSKGRVDDIVNKILSAKKDETIRNNLAKLFAKQDPASDLVFNIVQSKRPDLDLFIDDLIKASNQKIVEDWHNKILKSVNENLEWHKINNPTGCLESIKQRWSKYYFEYLGSKITDYSLKEKLHQLGLDLFDQSGWKTLEEIIEERVQIRIQDMKNRGLI